MAEEGQVRSARGGRRPKGLPPLERLIVCDLDNTLLGSDRRLDPELPQLIRRARERGIGFTLATGRVYASAVKYARRLGLELPLITNSGAVIAAPSGSVVLRQLELPRAVTCRLLAETREQGALRYLHVGGRVYAEYPSPENERYAAVLEIPFTYVGDLAQWFTQAAEPAVALVVRFTGGDVPAVTAAARLAARESRRFKGTVSVIRALPYLVEFLHPQASKGQALRFLADHLGVPREKILALGDSEGDLDMLTAAGTGILVRNAPEELHSLADRVTAGAAAEGVKEVLRELLR